jgi:hypothetical protein
MESLFRKTLIDWLSADPMLSANINVIAEESPIEGTPPIITIATSASTDWSTKSGPGREVRIALELVDRHDQNSAMAANVARIEQRIATLAPSQAGYRIVVTQFLRSRAEQRPRALRAVLLEYRFRLLDTSTE